MRGVSSANASRKRYLHSVAKHSRSLHVPSVPRWTRKSIDDVLEKSYQRFLLHYNFPPFCTGEAKAQRGVGRREIGHGHLAWRGLKGQILLTSPYTVRLVSQILESNGSSSMATVRAGTLALMDAGVPIEGPSGRHCYGSYQEPGRGEVRDV